MVKRRTGPEVTPHSIIVMEKNRVDEELMDAIRTVVEKAVQTALATYLPPKEDVLLSRKATAERLHCHVSTLWRYEKNSYLVPLRRGGAVFYRSSDIERIERGEMRA